MSDRTRPTWLWLPMALIVGVVLAFAVVPVIASLAAVAAPVGLLDWFKGQGLLLPALFSWSVLVVYGLSIVLPVAAVSVLLFRVSRRYRIALSACLGVGILLSLYVLVPLASGRPPLSPLIFPWWQHGLEASLLLAFAIALGVSRVLRMTKRPNDGPSRTAAT